MPVQRCKIGGHPGWKWGQSGKCYPGKNGKAKAERQASAIYASGYTGNIFCPTGPGGGIDPTCSPGNGGVHETHGGGIPAVHFTSSTIEGAFKPGTFFATSSAAEGKLRAGLGGGETKVEGRTVQVTINPKNPIDLNDWEKSRSLLKRVKNYQGYANATSENLVELGFSEPRKFWDALFDRPDATRSLVDAARKAGFDALRYDTKKDDAGTVIVAVNPAIIRQVIGNTIANRFRKRKPNPLRADPTRTATVRRKFIKAVHERFIDLRRMVLELVVEEDAFGLEKREPLVIHSFCPTGEGGGIDPTCSPHITQPMRVGDVSKGKFTPQQLKALADYKRDGHDGMNRILRGHWKGGEIREDFKNMKEQMDKAFLASHTKAEALVFRGVAAGEVPSLKPGDIHSDLAYVSTSMDKKSADQWGQVTLEIRVPAGTPAIYMEDKRITAGQSVYGSSQEKEVLLPRGSKFRVTKIESGVRPRVIMQMISVGATGVENVFCPTGEGGGIDPTCSPDEGRKHVAEQHEFDFEEQFTSSDPDYITPLQSLTAREYSLYRDYVKGYGGRDDLIRSMLGNKNFQSDLHHRLKTLYPDGYVMIYRGGGELGEYSNGTLSKETAFGFASSFTGFESVGKGRISAYLVPIESVVGVGEPKELEVFFRREGSSKPLQVVNALFKLPVGARMVRGLTGVYYYYKGRHYRVPATGNVTTNQPVLHSFCPTGEGGGIDPTCSPGSAGAGKMKLTRGEKFWVQAYQKDGMSRADAIKAVIALRKEQPKAPEVTKAPEPTNPDTLKYVEKFNQVTKGSIGQGAFILPTGKLVDVGSETAGGGDHFGIASAMDNAEHFGVDPALSAQVSRDYESGAVYEDPNALGRLSTFWDQLYAHGVVRVRKSGDVVGIDLDKDKVSPPKILEYINEGKIPRAREYTIENPKEGYMGVKALELSLSQIADITSWNDLDRPKKYESPFSQFRTNVTTNQPRRRWEFATSADKVKLFQQWLQQQMKMSILPGDPEAQDTYWRRFVEEGYRKGAGRAFEDTRKFASQQKLLGWYQGTQEDFLRSSFGRPVAVDKVKLLAGRVFTELKGVTDQMAVKLTRGLTDGIAQGMNPLEVGRRMANDIDEMDKKRATLIARTEIIRAHAEGQLDALKQLGVEDVGVMVEWLATDDDRLCDQCAELANVVLTIDEARGLIPRHPNCRCAFIPANVGESKVGQVRGKGDVEEAFDESVKEEGGQEKSDWLGADRSISKARPTSILDEEETENVFCPTGEVSKIEPTTHSFCPTGEGGGVDPTCSLKGGGIGGEDEKFHDPSGYYPPRNRVPSVGYHTTDTENLPSIAEKGLLPQVSTTGGGGGDKPAAIYLNDKLYPKTSPSSPESALSAEDSVVLRVKTGQVDSALDDTEVREFYEYSGDPNKHIGVESAFLIGKRIDPKNIEVMSLDGKRRWTPLAKYIQSKEYKASVGKAKKGPAETARTIGGRAVRFRDAGEHTVQVFLGDKFLGVLGKTEISEANDKYLKQWIKENA